MFGGGGGRFRSRVVVPGCRDTCNGREAGATEGKWGNYPRGRQGQGQGKTVGSLVRGRFRARRKMTKYAVASIDHVYSISLLLICVVKL